MKVFLGLKRDGFRVEKGRIQGQKGTDSGLLRGRIQGRKGHYYNVPKTEGHNTLLELELQG